MRQLSLDQDYEVSLPQKRTNAFSEKERFSKKELTDTAKGWLVNHDYTNWGEMALLQDYTTKSKKGVVIKKILWKLPGTQVKKDDCGEWMPTGCFNIFAHPEHKAFVKNIKRSCFRSCCVYCWLEKWLPRESTRATQRIEKYAEVWKRINPTCLFRQRKYLNPIHVIVSPPWKDKFLSFDVMKKKARRLLNEAGVVGGLMIYHPFAYDKKILKWVVRPHVHVIGYGWVVSTKKISDESGWVIKNKGIRDSLHSTIYYQLSHAGVSNDVHSITWFGELGYSAKFSPAYEIEDAENHDYCDFCGCFLVSCKFVGLDRPPPDYEFVGLVDYLDWKSLETIAEAIDRKNKSWYKSKPIVRGYHEGYWNKEAKDASKRADYLLRSLS